MTITSNTHKTYNKVGEMSLPICVANRMNIRGLQTKACEQLKLTNVGDIDIIYKTTDEQSVYYSVYLL